MKKKISSRSVDAFTLPKDKTVDFLWDLELAGFRLMILPSGRKIYVVQKRINGRPRRVVIGQHGPITPTQARNKALELLGRIGAGIDPITERRVAREARTFKDVAADYLAPAHGDEEEVVNAR